VQTFFDLNSPDKEIISSKENFNVIELLKRNNKFSIIIGDKKSGKSFLAKKYSKFNEAELIFEHSASKKYAKKVYLDLNQLPLNEESFFHFIQYFITQNLGLTIFTSTNLLNLDSTINFIPDTLSRLKSFNIESIDKPGDELFFRLVEKFLEKKSISVSVDIIKEIMIHINRNYIDAYEASETINYLLYKNNHNINLSLIRKHYEQI
tara:strand:- start:669 stop:1289 length:621 start_codon:yes stop_codon:yes gene_type:complete